MSDLDLYLDLSALSMLQSSTIYATRALTRHLSSRILHYACPSRADEDLNIDLILSLLLKPPFYHFTQQDELHRH